MNISTIQKWAVKPQTAKAGFYALGFGIGFGTGFVVARKVVTAQYELILENEIKKTKDYYKVLYKKDEYKDISKSDVEEAISVSEKTAKIHYDRYSAPRKTEDTVVVEGEETEEESEEPEEGRTYSALDDDAGDPNITEEDIQNASWHPIDQDGPKEPNPDPYLISEEEFRENLVSHRQTEWTYYEGDGSIVDETDSSVTNPESVLGEIDLGNFDDLSADGVMLYIRNERLELDVVLAIDYGSWGRQALGVQEERSLEHEYRRNSRKVRKFRSDDG